MKGVMEANGRDKPTVHDPRNHLTQDLNKDNSVEVAADIGNDPGCLPHAIFCEESFLESHLE